MTSGNLFFGMRFKAYPSHRPDKSKMYEYVRQETLHLRLEERLSRDVKNSSDVGTRCKQENHLKETLSRDSHY